MTTPKTIRFISIALIFAVFCSLLILVSHNAHANSKKHPYRTHFPKEWSAQAELPQIQIWNHRDSSSSLVSATTHPLAPSSSSENSVTPNGVLHKSEGPIPLKDLEGFLKSRATKMAKVGLRDWKVEKAEVRVLPHTLRAIDFYGTYLGASGAHFCFRERQVNLKKVILQITATRKQQDHCDWTELTRWLEYVTPSPD